MLQESSDRSAFQQAVSNRFGLVPNFFQSASDAPELVQRLWDLARDLYLDGPIPSLFKERLFVYLSRYCEVRYCIVRHCGFLIGLGHSSGDPLVQVESVAQAIKLLKTLTPWERDLNAVLLPLEAISTPIDWPEPETDLEDCLFAAATVVFVEPLRSDRERAALRNALGGQRFEHLMGLLTFIRTAHYWTKIHPDLGFEDDVRQMLDQQEELARLLLEDPEAARCEMGVRLLDELNLLRALNERHELEKAKQALEERYHKLEMEVRRLVDANIIGILTAKFDGEGEIVDANEAFLRMVGYGREDLLSRRILWTDLTPTEWRDTDARAVAELRANGVLRPIEKEFFRKDGSRVPVLAGAALFEEGGNEGVAFVLDLSERKQAEDALHSTQAELARVARLTTMAALSASITHEIAQPLAAIVTNGDACLRLLAPDKPNLDETRKALASMIRDGQRAVDVVARVRALLKKSDSERTPLDLGQLIREVLMLVQPEVATHRIVLRTSLADDLPPVLGDRIHLQQVVLNLITNSIEAMRDVADRNRELLVSAHRHEMGAGAGVLVAVQDTGVGFEPADGERLFETLYTTKPDGLGMGLSISRSIVEAYQGRLWGTPNAGHGATFQFVLSAWGGSMS